MSERLASGDGAALADIAAFLRGVPPFDLLDDDALNGTVRALRIAYHRQGGELPSPATAGGLFILRSGATELRDSSGVLIERCGEGDCFAVAASRESSFSDPSRQAPRVHVIEDALVYRLPEDDFRALRRSQRAVDRHFTAQRDRRVRRAARYQPGSPEFLAAVRGAMARDLLTVPPTATVRDAARAMAERRVSSILVTDAGRLRGIVTDRDLRTRVLAADRSPETPVMDVMTADPVSLGCEATLLDAMLLMTARSVHHLPVVEGGATVGMLSTSDLIAARRNDPVHLVQRISRAEATDELAELAAQNGSLLQHWIAAGMQPQPLSRLLTAVSDALLVRLVQLAEVALGPAPAPWAWLAFGSQARAEQLPGADQDNGIVIDDDVANGDLDWYASLAARVCEGLDTCGYAYCRGSIMARESACRQRLGDWKARVRQWAEAPTPTALMRVSIFFDLRAVYGERSLAQSLQAEMLAQASRNTIFLAALAAAVLEIRPPLGIFRRFVVERDGEQRDRLDIKKRGVLPITEIVRVHALANAVSAVNTDERLQALADAGHLSIAAARNLADALHCLQRIRMQHMGERLASGASVDNFVNPRALPRLAREELRDAFTIIDEAQTHLRQAFLAGLA